MLPDEVLKEIEKGLKPLRKCGGAEICESYTAFATRIAELATKLEREACVKMCNGSHEANYELYRRSRHSYDDGRCDEAAALAEAIEARGK